MRTTMHMKTILISEEMLNEVIKLAFRRGESWGTTYSTWFIPTQDDTDAIVSETIEMCKDTFKISPSNHNPIEKQ